MYAFVSVYYLGVGVGVEGSCVCGWVYVYMCIRGNVELLAIVTRWRFVFTWIGALHTDKCLLYYRSYCATAADLLQRAAKLLTDVFSDEHCRASSTC